MNEYSHLVSWHIFPLLTDCCFVICQCCKTISTSETSASPRPLPFPSLLTFVAACVACFDFAQQQKSLNQRKSAILTFDYSIEGITTAI